MSSRATSASKLISQIEAASHGALLASQTKSERLYQRYFDALPSARRDNLIVLALPGVMAVKTMPINLLELLKRTRHTAFVADHGFIPNDGEIMLLAFDVDDPEAILGAALIEVYAERASYDPSDTQDLPTHEHESYIASAQKLIWTLLPEGDQDVMELMAAYMLDAGFSGLSAAADISDILAKPKTEKIALSYEVLNPEDVNMEFYAVLTRGARKLKGKISSEARIHSQFAEAGLLFLED